jgi:pimeloyl-ACP methyl ester carboxylesterase
MFDLLDRYLLSRTPPRDERTITSRRIDGDPLDGCDLLIFLPWNTPFWLAQRLGFVGRRFTACYELAPSMASSRPESAVMALQWIVEDAEALLAPRRRPVIVAGYSLGTYPAIYLANRLRTRVYAVAPADRGDLMIWQSPAAADIRRRARTLGLTFDDFARVISGYNPVDNLEGLAKGSAFVIGDADPFIPQERSQALIRKARRRNRDIRIIRAQRGHLRTLIHGSRLIRDELSKRLRPKPLRRARLAAKANAQNRSV